MYGVNNYGYNPYGRYIPQQPMQQPIQPIQTMQQVEQTQSGLNGELVDSVDVAKTIKYQLDGSVSYYPLLDNSCIVTKQLQNDGTTKMTIYKPVVENEAELSKYITYDDLKDAIKNIDLSDIDDLKDEIKDLKKEIKDLKKKKGD